jgi:6-phosphogluconolactonase
VGNGATALAIDPRGRFLYVANGNSNNVSALTIDNTTGALTAIPGSPVTVGNNPIAVEIDPTGQFVYVASSEFEDDGSISGFRIDATTGALTAVTGSPSIIATGAQSIAVDPSGRFVYVPNTVSNDVSRYSIDATTGALTPGAPVTAGNGPMSIVLTVGPTPVIFRPRFAYVANLNSDTVSAFAIDAATGALTPAPGSPFAAGVGPIAVTVDPTGRFAYVANAGSNDISGYTIDPASGGLSPIAGSPFPAGEGPSSVITVGTVQ